MESLFWKIIITILVLSFLSAILVLIWFFKTKDPMKISERKIPKTADPGRALKRWKVFAVCWPLLCLFFAGIILCLPVRNMEERICDAGFTIFPLIFFAIGMTMRRRLLKERRYAVCLTTAAVLSTGWKVHAGKSHYFPEYEFQAGENTYRVQSPCGYSTCFVKKGDRVELYYAPKNPKLFYVPIMQKHDNRWALLLCGVGVIFPLAGLFAPQIRAVFSFLESY